MSRIYADAFAEVIEYGRAMGWVHHGTDICDLFETMTNMDDLDNAGNLEDDIRPSFMIVWNNFSKLFEPKSTEES